MTKFDDMNDSGFISVAGELERIAKKMKAEHNETESTLVAEATSVAPTVPGSDDSGGDSIAIKHIGNNIKSNVLYGGTQSVHGNVTIGKSDSFLKT